MLEAAVVGRPDDIFGKVPVAFVSLKPGNRTDAIELMEHCRTSLARFKLPARVHSLEELPKNSVGKLAKTALPPDASPD